MSSVMVETFSSVVHLQKFHWIFISVAHTNPTCDWSLNLTSILSTTVHHFFYIYIFFSFWFMPHMSFLSWHFDIFFGLPRKYTSSFSKLFAAAERQQPTSSEALSDDLPSWEFFFFSWHLSCLSAHHGAQSVSFNCRLVRKFNVMQMFD